MERADIKKNEIEQGSGNCNSQAKCHKSVCMNSWEHRAAQSCGCFPSTVAEMSGCKCSCPAHKTKNIHIVPFLMPFFRAPLCNRNFCDNLNILHLCCFIGQPLGTCCYGGYYNCREFQGSRVGSESQTLNRNQVKKT